MSRSKCNRPVTVFTRICNTLVASGEVSSAQKFQGFHDGVFHESEVRRKWGPYSPLYLSIAGPNATQTEIPDEQQNSFSWLQTFDNTPSWEVTEEIKLRLLYPKQLINQFFTSTVSTRNTNFIKKKCPQNITGQKEINTSPVMNLVLLINFSILKRFEAQSLIDSVLNSETNVDFNNRRNLLMSVNEAGFQIQTTIYVYILCVGFFF